MVIALVTGFAVGQGGGTFAAILGMMVISVVATILVVRRLQAWYTRYALTDFRLIRSWGVLKRQLAWIPWSKVTDVLLVQTLAGRILGYATVRIESANEASGFKAVTDLRDPHRFHRVVTEMVQAKQGKTVPPWMKPDNPAAAPAADRPAAPRPHGPTTPSPCRGCRRSRCPTTAATRSATDGRRASRGRRSAPCSVQTMAADGTEPTRSAGRPHCSGVRSATSRRRRPISASPPGCSTT